MASSKFIANFVQKLDEKLKVIFRKVKIKSSPKYCGSNLGMKREQSKNVENCNEKSSDFNKIDASIHFFSRDTNFNDEFCSFFNSERFKIITISAIFASFFLIYEFNRKKNLFLLHAKSLNDKNDQNKDKNTKIYTQSDIKKHNTKETGIWVTYKNGVYDITNFVDVHPGGDKILLAAGGAIDPFWALYAVHKTPEVLEILEEMRIGTLDPKEVVTSADLSDPYANDPIRHPALIACSQKPFNAETPPSLLNDTFLTPNELFFVRNHLPVPRVDIDQYRLEVGGLGLKTKLYTLNDLKMKFKPVKIVATLQCAGNRRNEMNPVKPVKGLEWKSTAISNAEWTGVRLREVLAASGLNYQELDRNPEKYANFRHVQFEGLDKDPTGAKYGASIEFEKAIDLKGDVILAYEMNGQPLPLDHGFPLRAIVPGVVGARNVKWLSKIIVSDEESHSHWQRNDYKSFSPSTDWDTVDFTKAPSIQEYPVQSAVCAPYPGQVFKKDCREIEVKGYAWSGGGRAIIRVDISSDGGKTWRVAELDHDLAPQAPNRSWAWTLWSCKVPVPEDTQGNVQLICKATDIVYNTQPDSVAGIWNLRGVLNNAWHRVNVNIQ